MQNYHRHTSYSNIFTPDSAAVNEDYAKRAKELGHNIISSVEHGWQGYYFQTYELAKKYDLKCVIGAEAYWVQNRLEQDRQNNHIIMLAKSNQGREAINDVLSEANITGYYYKPRVDLELLLSLPPADVFVTSACIAFNGYGLEISDDIILQLHNHFKDNFMLEVQYHNTESQIRWNKHLAELSDKYDIQLIAGLDSHYIYPKEAQDREYILEAKHLYYEDEDGWYMDYPDDNETYNRFKKQNALSDNLIKQAINNTNITLDFCDYDNVHIFTKDIKLPTLYPELTQEEKNKKYSRLISQKFKDYTSKYVSKENYQRYFDGVKMEIQTYKDTGMVDYPLLDYAIVKDAKEHGGLITDTGRGSAVGYFTNTLCGFSNVDRFTAAIKLYPERFISTTRILETHSLPDIDINCGNPSVFEDSQVRVLGKDHVAPMIAFGTFKKKSAFKLYARAMNMDFELANKISNQIGDYEEALKNAEEDEVDDIDIHNYVSEEYWGYLEQSEKYQGIISDKKKAPSAYLLYQGNIRKEIGLIKCKSESTKKECITCVIDGAIAENYKFLKNDLLKVDVVLLIDKVFRRIGIEHFDVNTLLQKLKEDNKVWDLYSKGYTIGVNQVEKDGSRHKVMKYKPKNISELSAFVAAIRPGFKSMYSRFEAREDFSWGIDVLDNLLKTEELPTPFIYFQEQCMSVLNYAGFPMDQCYGIIKAIAKKHPEKVRPLKQQFLEGFKKQVIIDEKVSDETAADYADRVWVIINDNCGYAFNSAHAFCMALDSSYQAWQKSHYPYEFYEVMLQYFSEKGKKDKVSLFKKEMKKAYDISEGQYKFGLDNRKFTLDKENHCINPALVSIKGLSYDLSEKLYQLSQENTNTFVELLTKMKEQGIASDKINILICIDYFSDYGDINKLLIIVELYNKIYGKKQFKKEKLEELEIPEYIIKKYAIKETAKMYSGVDTEALLNEMIERIEVKKTTLLDKINYQQEYLGYISEVRPSLDDDYYYVQEISGNWLTLYQLNSGDILKIKARKNALSLNPIYVKQIIKADEIREEKKWRKVDGEWIRIDETEPILISYQVLQRKQN